MATAEVNPESTRPIPAEVQAATAALLPPIIASQNTRWAQLSQPTPP